MNLNAPGSTFLSKASAEWKSKIRKSTSPSWPVGLEINRSEGMVNKVSFTPGSIGWAELTYCGGQYATSVSLILARPSRKISLA
jgi:phosphate transport system substrate-binding protein